MGWGCIRPFLVDVACLWIIQRKLNDQNVYRPLRYSPLGPGFVYIMGN